MRAVVVLPTYNERDNIEPYLRALRSVSPDIRVLVVDDNSPDGTADLARATAAELGQIEVLDRPKKDGLGNAYRAGFRLGIDRGYEVLLETGSNVSSFGEDADGELYLADHATGTIYRVVAGD